MAFLVDIDGTLIDAGRPVDGAPAAVEELRRRGPLCFVTNTSRRSRADVAASLRAAGFVAAPEDILSAGHAAAARLRERGVRRVQLLLTDSAAEDYADFDVVTESPEAVVVGDLGAEIDFPRINAAFRSLHAGAALVATQKNRFWKAADGPTLDAGAWVAALEYAAGVTAEVVGKPEAGFFRAALGMLGAVPEAAWMVGDDVHSDVGGARACGLRGVLVRTGKFDAAELARAEPGRAPDLVVDSIAELPAALP
ncbi:MAG: TIGR01458 family HAD-type hydrolase [Gemmatimonadetes bacterium]|nr:TIGR01458 family HAD-type hydrolase [Gemmatimonadota bacterium]